MSRPASFTSSVKLVQDGEIQILRRELLSAVRTITVAGIAEKPADLIESWDCPHSVVREPSLQSRGLCLATVCLILELQIVDAVQSSDQILVALGLG